METIADTTSPEHRPPQRGDGTSVHRSLAAVMVVAALAIGDSQQGGFAGPVQLVMAGLLALATLLSWLGGSQPADLGRVLRWAGAGVCASATISAAASGNVRDAIGTVALVMGMGAVCGVARGLDRGERDSLAVALIALGCVVALTGWFGLVAGRDPWVVDAGLRRASTSLTYPNAAAGLLAPLALVAMARAPTAGRVAHAGCCLPAIGVVATLSRAGIAAFIIGMLVLGVVSGWRRLLRGAVPALVGAGVAIAGLAPAFVDAPASPLPPLVGLGLGLVAAMTLGRRSDLTLGIVGAVTVVALMVGATAGAAGFLADGGRWNLSEPYRPAAMAAALDVGFDRPLLGAGPGQADLSWRDPGGQILVARFAHNEYAQTFAETGTIGLAVVVVLIGSTARALGRARDVALDPSLRAGALAAGTAFYTHSLADFLWRLPTLPLTLAAIVGLALPPLRRQEDT